MRLTIPLQIVKKSSTVDRSASSPGEDTWKKKNNKSFTICTVTNDAESNRLSSYTRPYSLTLLASKSSVSQRRGRDYPKETGISCQRSTERHSNGANTDYDTPTVTSQQYGIRAIFVSGDVRFQDGDNVDLSETGGGGIDAFFRILLLSSKVITCVFSP